MATQQAHRTNAWLAPVLAGMLGAGLALLFAPRSGKETREKISSRADDLKQQAGEGVQSVRESLNHSLQEAQDLKDRIAAALKDSSRQTTDDENMDRPKAPAAQSSVLSTWEEEV
jgi:gas vesicle protein